jgi:hypothetical protein
LREDARVPGFSTAEEVGKRNRTAGDEQDTAPDGTTYRRSGPQRPLQYVASGRAGILPAADVNVAIRPKPQARNASPRGSAELADLSVSEVGLTTRFAGELKGAIRLLIFLNPSLNLKV